MYKIAVIAHALKGNRVARFNDIVSESDLNGNAKDLEKQGFIKKATEDEVKEWKKAKTDDGSGSGLDSLKAVKDMNKDELLAYAKEIGLTLTGEHSNNDKRKAAINEFLVAKKEREELEGKAKENGIEFTEDTTNEDLERAISTKQIRVELEAKAKEANIEFTEETTNEELANLLEPKED